jgi:hypothetical protein
MTAATAAFVIERLQQLERQAMGLAALEVAVPAELIDQITAEFHRWKDERESLPLLEDILVLIAVAAAYLQDGI